MYLKSLKLENFRNHKLKSLNFENKTINLFLGDNGVGKTNLIEAIYVCSLTKSFKTNHLSELVDFGSDFCRIQSDIFDEKNGKLEFFYQKNPSAMRALKKDNVRTPINKYIGKLLVSFFCPDDLNLVYLEPARRRRYLNIVLSQISQDYLENLINYEKVVLSRNKLLKMIFEKKAKISDLQVWDSELVAYGQKIVDKRKEFFEEIKEDLKNLYKEISYQSEHLDVEYKYNLDLKAELNSNLSEDLRSCRTSIGPHRDDFIFYLDGHDISSFGSRGECRSAVLGLKFAERNFFYKKLNKFPIMLMDDVFSELDKKRQHHILTMLENSQVFISSAVDDFEDDLEGRIRKIYL